MIYLSWTATVLVAMVLCLAIIGFFKWLSER